MPPPVEFLKMVLPVARLMGYGMDYADAVALHAAVDAGADWADAAIELADGAQERAVAARDAGASESAATWFFAAASCFRFAAFALQDRPELHREVSYRVVSAFGAAAGLVRDRLIASCEVPFEGASLPAWLVRPLPGVEPPPTVIFVGSVDGVKEEHEAVSRLLAERGLASLLVDLPGQGVTALESDLRLQDGGEAVMRSCVTYLRARGDVSARVAIWGTSLGGAIAAGAASAAGGDDQLGAIVLLSTSQYPSQIVAGMPEPLNPAVAAFAGVTTKSEAVERYGRLDLHADVLSRIECPTLVVQGGLDHVPSSEAARVMFDQIKAAGKRYLEFPAGDHCVTNLSLQKDCAVSDWLVGALRK